MKMKKESDEEDRMMFIQGELGDEYLIWFVEFKVKPRDWQKIKMMFNVNVEEEMRGN
jgi:hypothetical protein